MRPMLSMEAALNPNGDTEVMLYVVLSLIGLCLENSAYTKLYYWSMKWWYRRKYGGTKETIAITACLPGRTQTAIAMVWSGIFTLFGLLVLTPIFGGFGICWTLLAGLMTGVHTWQFFIKYPASRKKQGGRSQLEQLESLKDAGLIDDREYRQKREQILKEP